LKAKRKENHFYHSSFFEDVFGFSLMGVAKNVCVLRFWIEDFLKLNETDFKIEERF